MTATTIEENRHHDALGRRSRFDRQRTGKRLVLGQCDLEILQWLYRYLFHRQTHLWRLLQPVSPKRFTERLGDLFHESGLINRLSIQLPQFDARSSPMLYETMPSGIGCLASHNAMPYRAITFSRRSSLSYGPQHIHTMNDHRDPA
jgi:hypothetical protein